MVYMVFADMLLYIYIVSMFYMTAVEWRVSALESRRLRWSEAASYSCQAAVAAGYHHV